jgi:hypothetical protein
MLLFRSEETLSVWRERRELPDQGRMSLDTMWRLGDAWYHDRMDPAWQRKPAPEAQKLFTELGLTGEYWSLQPAPPP